MKWKGRPVEVKESRNFQKMVWVAHVDLESAAVMVA